jgi:hypothetical protein
MARNSAPRSAANVPTGPAEKSVVRCAIYTRKSTEEGLQQEFNSLDAQREAAEAYIASPRGEGWQVGTEHFDDGGYTGGNMDRPARRGRAHGARCRQLLGTELSGEIGLAPRERHYKK